MWHDHFNKNEASQIENLINHVYFSISDQKSKSDIDWNQIGYRSDTNISISIFIFSNEYKYRFALI